MARLSRFQEFVLTFQSPWNLGAKTTESWSQSFYVTGTVTHTDPDAETAGLALAGPTLALANPTTSLIKISYYPSASQVATVVKTYAPGTHPGLGNAYSGVAQPQQLEVCAVAHAPIGKNTRGKTIYLRKYFHAVSALGTNPNALGTLVNPTGLLGVYNTGAGPHNVVPCSPSSGGTASSPWTMETHLFTHQLRKGKKHKVPASQSLFDQVARTIGEAAALELLKKALTGVALAGG